MKILIICTGNTCRSQMAAGFLKNKYIDWDIFSAGTEAEEKVNPFAIEVMKEINIDISSEKPERIENYLGKDFDYVFTVCDEAKEICPVFTGIVKHNIHTGFEDPANATGTNKEVLPIYRKVRNQIIDTFDKFRFNN